MSSKKVKVRKLNGDEAEYFRKYRKEWEKTYPFIRKSLDSDEAFCKTCKKNIYPKKSNIKLHSQTLTHLLQTTGDDEITMKTGHEQEESVKQSNTIESLKIDPDLFSEFKSWLIPNPHDCSKAVCKCCRKIFKSQKKDIMRHLSTKRHISNFDNMSKDAKNPLDFSINGESYNFDDQDVVRGGNVKLKCEVEINKDHSYFTVENKNTPINDLNSYFSEFNDSCRSIEINADNADSTPTIDKITELASRIGVIVTDDIEKMLRIQKSLIFQVFGTSFESATMLEKEKLDRMTKLCIANLSKEYFIDVKKLLNCVKTSFNI